MKTRKAILICLIISMGSYLSVAGTPSSPSFVDGKEIYEENTKVPVVFEADTIDMFSVFVEEEQEYKEDFPFDTRAIYLDYILLSGVEDEEEEEFDDMPFDTFELYCAYLSLDTGERMRNIDKYYLACLCKNRSMMNSKICQDLQKEIQAQLQQTNQIVYR